MPLEYSTPLHEIQNHLQDRPDKTAFLFLEQGEAESDRMTFRELDRSARAIAAQLRRLAQPGDRVLLVYPPGLDFARAIYGCLYGGLIPVPASPPRPNSPADRLFHQAKDCQAAVALGTSETLKQIPPYLERLPELQKLPWLDHAELEEDQEAAWAMPDITPEDLAFIQYTSGSTSDPRGVRVSYRNLSYNRHCVDAMRVREREIAERVTVNWAPTFHDMGLLTSIFQPVFEGSLSVIMPPVAFLHDPACWLRAISKYRGTAAGAPNFAYDLCVLKIAEEERSDLDLSTWLSAWNGAEPIRVETLKRFSKAYEPYGFDPATFVPGYGLAESTLVISAGPGRKTPRAFKAERASLEKDLIVEARTSESGEGQSLAGSGSVLHDLKVAIVHPETRAPCAPFEVGEIWVSGESVCEGYWNRPEATQEVFKARIAGTADGPYLRTGDLGFVHEGELYVTGRLKDMIITMGRNHYPQDIEITVQQCDPVLRPGRGAAFGIELEGMEQLVVVQEAREDAEVGRDLDELLKKIRIAIAQCHEIRAYAVVLIQSHSLPLTSSGKVMRKESKRQFLEGELEVVAEWRSSVTQPLA